MPKSIASNNKTAKITDEFKQKIMNSKGEITYYDTLQHMVQDEVYWLKANKLSYDFSLLHVSISELIERITDDLYLAIQNGKFINTTVNLEIICHNAIYNAYAESLGMNKNQMWLIRRVKNLCSEHDIGFSPQNAHKIARLSTMDKYSSNLSIRDAYVCLTWLYQHQNNSLGNLKLRSKRNHTKQLYNDNNAYTESFEDASVDRLDKCYNA